MPLIFYLRCFPEADIDESSVSVSPALIQPSAAVSGHHSWPQPSAEAVNAPNLVHQRLKFLLEG